MAGSADPTEDEFLDNLRYGTARLSAVQNEIIRRLQNNMPVMIERLNQHLGRPAGGGIPLPANYLPAPSVLTDRCLNAVLCAVAGSTSPNGTGLFRHTIEVTVYSIDRRVEHAAQIEDAFDRAAVAIAILRTWLRGCRNEAGQLVWRVLENTAHSLILPRPYAAGYSGTTACFTAVQDETCNCWDVD